MVAAVNLTAEYWNLIRMLIALLQPLLVLVLIAGLMVATAHLLTMIGTRWGDRRASSKAMFFSIVIHLLLIMGLVTLIPEYRSNLISKLAELNTEPIRISMLRAPSDEIADEPSEAGSSGSTGLFHAMPRSEQTRIEPERTEMAPQAASELEPLPKPADASLATALPSADRMELPEPAPATPVPEKIQSAPPLEQAQAEVKTESLPTQIQPEAMAPGQPRERSSAAPAMVADEQPAVPDRPNAVSSETSSASYAPDRLPPDQTDLTRPKMELSRTELSTSPLPSAPSPVPASSQTPAAMARPVPASTPDADTERLMSRTESRRPVSGAEDLAPSRPVRPNAGGEAPSIGRMEPLGGAASSTLPLPVEHPQLSRTVDPFSRPGEIDQIPSAYQLRTEEEREKAVQQFGGSQASEAAVDRSLKWMASVQNPAGYWNASDYGAGQAATDESGINRKNASREADVGVTALAVLAFLGKLNTVDQGTYSPQVNKALRWLVSQQTTKNWGEGWGSTPGYLGGNATEFESMYCHAMATFALGEAYAMSRDKPEAQWLRAPLEQAIYFILDVQNVDGGWRYIKGQREGDMSIFGWQVMALKSAEAAGLVIDPQRKLRMQKFLQQRQLGQAGGLAGYRSNEAATAAMTAEALYCRQVLGMAQDNRATQDAINMMMENLPHRTTFNFYYWYYGTLAMHQHGGPQWETWNAVVRDLLIAEQRSSGPLAGSWDPRDIWGGYGGRMYSTAIATLSLEVYYRYLPLYRLQNH